jgi:hypothetical protein
MSNPEPSAPLERLHFFDGQRLFASDLGGIDDYNRQMRWLHNQSLHQPGVGKGFAVSGAAGDRQVSIGAGYALDALGREIVLTRTDVEAVPPVAAEDDGSSVFFDLTVAYPADSQLVETETRQGICAPLGAVRLREDPSFCWVRLERDDAGNLQAVDAQLAADVKGALRIVLARAEVLQCKLKQPISTAERLTVRPVRQPYIACGQAAVIWGPLELPLSPNGNVAPPFAAFGLQAAVDTSAAAFVTTPSYTARIDGDRVLAKNDVHFVAEPLIELAAASPIGFLIKAVLIVQPAGLADSLTLDLFKGWQVVWMGVE